MVACLQADGWQWAESPLGQRTKRQRHLSMKHPTKAGKVSISHGITEFGPKTDLFRSILRQAGLSRKDLEAIYFTLFGGKGK